MFGGLITGVNPSTPNIPSVLTENVPPSRSVSSNEPDRAASASRVDSVLRVARSSPAVLRITGTIRPLSSATAMPTCASGSRATPSSVICEFTSG